MTFEFHKCNLELRNSKSEVIVVSPNIGRPVIGEPKTRDIKVRIDEKMHEQLIIYCKEKDVTKAEAIRRALHLLLSQ